VLTFHGLLDDGVSDSGLLDEAAHTRLSLFTELCEHLAKHYQVISASEVVQYRRAGKRLPKRSVVLTFDDGYESNYALAWPVLKRLGLPATIFLVSGYLDKTVLPWFIGLELALARTEQSSVLGLPLTSPEARRSAYNDLCGRIKELPWDAAMALLENIEAEVGVKVQAGDTLPPALRPMTWDMAREMQAHGLIELGGHTNTHPVLGRCTLEQAEREIRACEVRMQAELGARARLFAYPNGRTQDFNAHVVEQLQGAGFMGAFTMERGFVPDQPDLYALPRYGSPDSRLVMESMISGLAHWLRELRGRVSAPFLTQEVRA
jgi:peptidoglycan/xylan/chitin deacetylase (PgdA/CDA1 family)